MQPHPKPNNSTSRPSSLLTYTIKTLSQKIDDSVGTKNTFYSSMSIALALAMVYEGTDLKLRSDFEQVLGFSPDTSARQQSMTLFYSLLSSAGPEPIQKDEKSEDKAITKVAPKKVKANINRTPSNTIGKEYHQLISKKKTPDNRTKLISELKREGRLSFAVKKTLARDTPNPKKPSKPSEHGQNIGFQLTVGNSLWNSDQCQLQPEFVSSIQTMFKAHCEQLDMTDPNGSCDKVNSWISDKTAGLIKDMLKPDSLDPRVLLI
jgi:hypothetical protein